MKKIAVVTINQPSLNSASRLMHYLDGYEVDIYGKKNLKHNLDNLKIYNKLDDILPLAWKRYDAILCILAIGAVVRKIAPLLRDKSSDPAILVINLALDKIVPLLSGHLGRANELANDLVDRLPNAVNFISTATDQTNTIAFEMLAKKRDWRIENLKALAKISNRLLNKQEVKVATYKSIFDSIPDRKNLKLVDFSSIDLDRVVISPLVKSNSLTLIPKVSIGIGCNRGTSSIEIREAFLDFLEKYNLKLEDIKNINSFSAKSDEVGLLDFAKEYNFKIEFFTKEDINSFQDSFSKSASTKFFGLKGVAEPTAILGSNYQELIIKKEVYNRKITIAGAV